MQLLHVHSETAACLEPDLTDVDLFEVAMMKDGPEEALELLQIKKAEASQTLNVRTFLLI